MPFNKWLSKIGITIIKPETMIISESDLFVLIEINNDGAVNSPSYDLRAMNKYILEKYGDQPLKYFNEYKRLKLIHLKSGTIKDLAVKIDL